MFIKKLVIKISKMVDINIVIKLKGIKKIVLLVIWKIKKMKLKRDIERDIETIDARVNLISDTKDAFSAFLHLSEVQWLIDYYTRLLYSELSSLYLKLRLIGFSEREAKEFIRMMFDSKNFIK